MATITLTIPDALLSGLAASVRSAYGEAVAALSDADAALAEADTDFDGVA